MAVAQTKPLPIKTVKATEHAAPTTKPKLALTYTPAQSLKTTKDSASYALGYRIAQSLKGQGLQDVNFELFKKGMAAGVASKTEIPEPIKDLDKKEVLHKMNCNKENMVDLVKGFLLC